VHSRRRAAVSGGELRREGRGQCAAHDRQRAAAAQHGIAAAKNQPAAHRDTCAAVTMKGAVTMRTTELTTIDAMMKLD